MWCSDELVVHSCPLLRLQTQTLRNLRAHCSTVALCCVTIRWQRIFKGSLQVTIVHARFHTWLSTSDIFGRWCSDTVTHWRSQAKIIWGAKKFGGTKCLILGEQQYFFWDTASQSAKWLLILKIWGASPPGYAYAAIADNGKTHSFILCEKMHEWICSSASTSWKIHYSVRLWVRPMCLSEYLNQATLMQASFHAVENCVAC